MRITHRLTFRYAGVTTLVFSFMVLLVYLFSERTRESEFFATLTREAVTKANLFLSDRVDVATMQSIYHNNRNSIDEVEVALYTPAFELVYHDSQEIDLVNETAELVAAAASCGKIEFYEGDYQAIAIPYTFMGVDYVVTAAAYDGYGYRKQDFLVSILLVVWGVGILAIALIGYFFARSALQPVREIVREVGVITETSLDIRLPVTKAHDELDELSQTFNHMLDRLEESFRNQKMFVSNVAHEIRTPLAALIAELEITLLRDKRSKEEYREAISNALGDAKQLTHLVTGLLDLAKANYDFNQIVTTELRLDEILLDARQTVLKAQPNYGINLHLDEDLEDDSLITVVGNEYLLKIAFVNLMENNCKFSCDNRSKIELSSLSGMTTVHFFEKGEGIDQQDIEHLFTPFYRGANSVGIQGQGIGLGLTQRIIKLHRGFISVQSEKGKGTLFTLEIPHL